MTRMHRALRLLAVAACAMLIAGCETLSYYTQAVGGQLAITTRARPIDTVMVDPATSGELRARLRTALEIREFASSELGLPDDGSYRKYADLGRAFVVWNLFATPEFSTKPVDYCFPVIGCVSYRGYFAEADATAYAAKNARRGIRRAGQRHPRLLDPGLVRRPAAVHLHPLSRERACAPRVPRACPSRRVRQRATRCSTSRSPSRSSARACGAGWPCASTKATSTPSSPGASASANSSR